MGQAARERLSTHPDRTIASFKRFIGTNRIVSLGGKEFRAEDLSALVLRQLKDDAERALGEKIDEAIITVPAYFNDAQRKATKAAGQIAGLKVDRLLNEPTAAALAYGLGALDQEQRVMVLDLGGGTFDVSILEMFEGIMEVRASSGDNFLGGDDFADVIMGGFIDAVGKAAGLPARLEQEPAVQGALRRAAEIAKRALSEQDHHEIELIYRDQVLRWTITRDAFESLAEPLVKRLRTPIERAIRDAKLKPDEITHLVLAGGATRMPIFRRLAARLFQRLPMAPTNPDEVVAHGAAVQAGLKMRDAALDDVVMTDVAPYTMGTDVVKTENGKIVATDLYCPIIERNTTVPISREKRFLPSVEGQKALKFTIFQGESRLVTDNIKIGELEVALPAAPQHEQAVDLRFTYDTSGLLEVEAQVVKTKLRERLVIEGNPGVLSSEEIKAKLQALAALKTHPRDQSENQAVIARAERLYTERLGAVRELIADRTAEFSVLLEQQNLADIAAFRARFVEWLDEIDTSYFQ